MCLNFFIWTKTAAAAFGIFANRQWFFIMIALVILAVAVYIYVLLPQDRYYHPLRLCALLVGAGAIAQHDRPDCSSLCDRFSLFFPDRFSGL